MQPAIQQPGALLDRARADLGRPDASPQQLRSALAQIVPATEDLMAQVAVLQGQLERARTCPVTGLPTRSAWTTQAQDVLEAGPAAVLLIDLDAFKPVNDRFGHAAGDAVLAAVGARLTEWAAAEGAAAGRLGGDEFAVAIPDTPGLAARVAQLHTRLTAPVAHRELTLTVGASIGTARTAGLTLSAALKEADAEMYRVKGRGRRGRRSTRFAFPSVRRFADVLPFRKAAA
ncbi:Response regulator PleD [Streptomyces sp. ADI92-24]|uniref:GGDEF domain-containing protein n=1 Tax=Streptomyces sp. ADI92-24 TaxID=1522756 RepID=UPI000F55991A|nr:GGDEF domain-containing protein [Streptomyces sp. ADI92-24]RPK32654.1 Response regulator PleD [Streptomyces sp. ADI92-24]